jgi:hypothetical protein
MLVITGLFAVGTLTPALIGLLAAGGAGAGAGAGAGGGGAAGAAGLLKKHIGYSPNCEEDCSSKIFCRNSTTERCPPRHIRSACVSDNSGDLLGKR